MGHIKRRSWTPNEKSTVFRVFKQTLSTGKLPSLNKCQEAILFNKELQDRSPVQLKTWLHNQLKKNHDIPVAGILAVFNFYNFFFSFLSCPSLVYTELSIFKDPYKKTN